MSRRIQSGLLRLATAVAIVGATSASISAQTDGGRGASTAETPGAKALARVAAPFQALATFRAEFIRLDRWVGMDEPTEYRGTLYLMRPNRFRIAYRVPEGHVQVSDGTQVWTYVPENEQVLLAPLDASLEHKDFLTRILEESEADAAVAVESFEGSPAEVVRLLPPPGLELAEVRIWTRPASREILQYELTEASGNQSTYRLTKVEENPTLDPSLFVFEPPRGVPVVEVGAP